MKHNKDNYANLNPSNTKLWIRLTEIKLSEEVTTLANDETKLFYSLGDGDLQFFSSTTVDKDKITNSYKFKEKF